MRMRQPPVSPHHGRIIAVDFDGTCVADAYPNIGPSIGAERVLSRLLAHGAALILWTMRSGETLAEAETWFAERALPLRGVNHNPAQAIWTTSPKAHADLYIDDRAFGVPLTQSLPHHPPHVDWSVVERALFPCDPLMSAEESASGTDKSKPTPTLSHESASFPREAASHPNPLRRLFRQLLINLHPNKNTK